jgi:ArsR family transcriptional regulator, zinc-responsive transcriptional repressor
MKKNAKAIPASDPETKEKSEVRIPAAKKGAMLLEEHFQKVAFLAKSLSDENRLRILLCVGCGKKPVSGIVEEMRLSQPLVSHHLKELKRSLLVKVERSGPFIYYELVDPRILDVVQTLSAVAADLLAARKTF